MKKRHQTKLWNHFKHSTFILFHYKREASKSTRRSRTSPTHICHRLDRKPSEGPNKRSHFSPRERCLKSQHAAEIRLYCKASAEARRRRRNQVRSQIKIKSQRKRSCSSLLKRKQDTRLSKKIKMTKKQKSQHKMGSNNKNTQSILKETDLSSTQCVCALSSLTSMLLEMQRACTIMSKQSDCRLLLLESSMHL